MNSRVRTTIVAGFLIATVSFLSQANAATATKKVSADKSASKYSQPVISETTQRSDSPLEGKLEVEPNFGFAFLSPKDVNTLIRDNNDSLQKQGVKSFNIPELGSSTNIGMAATYRVIEDVGLGLGFNHVGSSSEGSAKVNNLTLNGKYATSANFLTAESRITFARSLDRKFEAVVAPFAGIGFYKATTEFGGSAVEGGSKEINSSASGFVFGSNVGARYWFAKNLAGGLTAGYRFAKSNTLKVDSQRNTDTAVGSEAENGGKKLQLDASAFMIGAQLTWAI